MKKRSTAFLLIALFAGILFPQRLYAQSSTEGKEFWVAATIVCQPPTASEAAVPFIAVSATKACSIEIRNNKGVLLSQAKVDAGSWTEFGNTNNTNTGTTASADNGPINYPLDYKEWYPNVNVISANDVYKHADETKDFGLHITATENISVFTVIRAKNSMDASNILPINAISSEYFTQDYWPNANGVSNSVSMVTILAVEDNTLVDITPKGNTYGKSNSGNTFTIPLNKGQTYYLISAVEQQLAGTHIKAKNDKKIAIFNGCPLTKIPFGIDARDGLYEQSMPIDYWGTQFVVTRSMHKDGNIIGVTAKEPNTTVSINGQIKTTIANAGDTYYFMMQSQYNPNSKNPGDKPLPAQDVLTADEVYLETSCPCAVYSYDTGNGFVYGKKSEEVHDDEVTENENQGYDDDRLGDPSSVWISPIQQKINFITFGTCYTDKTKMHYLNVVTETATRDKTILTAYYKKYPTDKTSLIKWNTVYGNPKYSYARVLVSNNTPDISVFTLSNPHGFVGYIYGNGDDESYAYSVGSAAVEQGINVDGVTYTHESRGETKLHVDSIIQFDSEVGTDEITRVDWDFGDGITQNGLGVTGGLVHNTHVYTSPGWYDVTAHLFGHQVCTDESEMDLGTITFTIRVAAPDTTFVYMNDCIPEDPSKPKIGVDTTYNDTDFSNVIDTVKYYTQASSSKDTIIASDLDTVTIGGKGYYVDPSNPKYEQDVDSLLPFPNTMGCDSIIHFHIKFATCLDIEVKNGDRALAPTDTLSICCLDSLEIEYKQVKGDVKNQGTDTDSLFYAYWVCNNDTTKIKIDNLTAGESTSIKISTKKMQPGHYDAALYWIDENCNNRSTRDTLLIPVHLDVLYSDSIFKPKFGNTLALYKKGYGGNTKPGWEFVAYQWYHDDKAIVGATEPVYYAPENEKLNGEYFVELTRKGETKPLRSCSQCFEDGKECEDAKSSTPPAEENTPNAAQKRLQNRQIVILRDGHTFNIYGQKVD